MGKLTRVHLIIVSCFCAQNKITACAKRLRPNNLSNMADLNPSVAVERCVAKTSGIPVKIEKMALAQRAERSADKDVFFTNRA